MTNKDALAYAFEKIESNKNTNKAFAKLKESSLETFFHCIDVGNIAFFIGEKYGLKDKQLCELTLAGVLHDIGKVEIEDEVLHCNRVYTQEEYDIMKRHIQYSYQLTKGFPKIIRNAVYEHHENYNGTGYPNQRYGKKISLYGQILRIADVADAMTSNRAYKQKMNLNLVCEHMKSESGDVFNPDLLDCFFEYIQEYTQAND